MTAGTLYLVATPIGNLGDMSVRAAQTLAQADFIAAEDTRVTRKLLEHLGIKKQLISYHEHNRRESGESIISRIQCGEICALVTDAGTPGISDPGEELVRLCAGIGIPVISIPGPCAAIAALAISGLSTGRFAFEGFLPTSGRSRSGRLKELASEKRTLVFYEAPHKLLRTLNDMLVALGDRRVSISRELTKIYDETMRCTISEAIDHFSRIAPRGEFVLIVEGAHGVIAPDDITPDIMLERASSAVSSYVDMGLSVKDAIKKAAVETGVPKNVLYNTVIKNSEFGIRNSE